LLINYFLFYYSFLYKNFITSAIITDGVKPTLSELKAFLEVLEDTQVEDLNEIPGSGVFGKENQVTTRSVSNGNNVAMCCEDKLKNSDKNDLHTHIVNEAVFNSKRESEQEDLKAQGKNARCVNEFQMSHFADVCGIRNQYQDQLSVKEHLIKNSYCYTVEILDKKRPSAVPTGNSQQALKDDDEEKKEAPSNKKPIVMRFKRKLRLSLLNDEAGSSMFGESKWDDSNEYTSNDEQSNVRLRNTDSIVEIDNIANSSILSSLSLNSSPIKQEIVEEDSVHLNRIRKTRCTQAEFIKDNTDYYKFQTPDSKLWYQAPLIDIKNIAVDDNKLAMKKSSQEFTEECKLPIKTNNDTAQKIHSSNLSAKIEGMKFSFEMIPKYEPWYQTYQRQCMNAEFQHSFSMYDAKKPFLLPYEIENFHEMLSQRNSHCHAFTAVTHEREEQESLNLCKIEESSLIRSCMDTSKLERKQDPTSDVDEKLKKITEEMKEIQSMENIEDGIGNVKMMNNFDLDLLPKFINEIDEKQFECSKKHTTELENNSLCANLKSGKAKINIRKRKRKINRTGWSLVRKKKKEKETKEKT